MHITLYRQIVNASYSSGKFLCMHAVHDTSDKGIGIVDLENSFLGLAARVCAIGVCHNQF